MTPDDAFERLRAADPAAGTEPDLARIAAAVFGATGVPVTGEHRDGVQEGGTPAAGAPEGGGPATGAPEGGVAATGVVEGGAPATGEHGAGAPGAGGPGRPHDELAARRRARSGWLRMAAAVAAVAVVGTGGYVASGRIAGGVPSSGVGVAALPAISLEGGTGDRAATNGPAAGASGSAQSSSAAADLPMPGGFAPYGTRTVFAGRGLSAAAGSATAWAFDASSVASAATAAHLATILGVSGAPRVEWGAWAVGPSDGSGPTLRLEGSGALSYYDPAREPWRCGTSSGAGGATNGATTSGPNGGTASVATSGPTSVAGGGAAVPPSGPDAAPVPEQTTPARPADPSVCATGTTPTGDAAIARARDVLTSLGIDTTGTQVQVDDSKGKGAGAAGAAFVNVAFRQVLDGRLTGVSWNVTLVGDGVQSLNGTLARLVSLGSYPVISPAAAAERLNDPRFGAAGGVAYAMGAAGVASSGVASSGPAGLPTPAAVATANPSQPPTVPPAPRPGAAIAWPVRHVTLVSAQLGVALTSQADGAQVLVPAYVLTDTTGATWSVVAVADDHLDFASR